jgi:hypothetical protein
MVRHINTRKRLDSLLFVERFFSFEATGISYLCGLMPRLAPSPPWAFSRLRLPSHAVILSASEGSLQCARPVEKSLFDPMPGFSAEFALSEMTRILRLRLRMTAPGRRVPGQSGCTRSIFGLRVAPNRRAPLAAYHLPSSLFSCR